MKYNDLFLLAMSNPWNSVLKLETFGSKSTEQ